MDSSTVNTTTFKVAAGATDVAGTVTLSADGLTATFDPTTDLAPNTDHTVTLTRGIKDLGGNALAREEWTFRTGTTADTTPPTVESTVPAPGALGVLVGANITATFSEAMLGSSISTSTFTVTGAASVSGTVTLAADNVTAIFDPGVDLDPNTIYTVTITNGVKDLASNQMSANYQWTFTTAP